MKKNLLFKTSLFAVIAICFTFSEASINKAKAQISINSANMPVSGNTYYFSEDTLANTAGSAGANQQWDFSSLNNHGNKLNQFVNPSMLTGYPYFSNSNLGMLDSGNEIFLNLDSSSMDIMGYYGDYGYGASPIPFTPPQTFLTFPSNYLTSFADTFKYVLTFDYTTPPVDSIRIISTTKYSSDIDSWGTISTPAFSGLNALRQKFTEIASDSIFVKVYGSWVFSGQAPTVDTVVKYRWWSDSKSFPVLEVVADGNGNVNSATYLIDPPPPAVISFTATPTSGCAPLTVDFTNTSTGAAYYQWYFGDDSTYIGFDTAHTYTKGNYYYVSLAGFDADYNYLGNAYTIIYVGGSSGFFEMASDSVCPGDEITFRGQDAAIDYEWNFGDGSAAGGGQYTSHTFSAVGTYPVSLIVTTTCGIDTIVQNVYVGNNVIPDADFNLWPSVVCPNEPVNVYSSAVGNNYQWNFGDTSTASGQEAQHSYSNFGTYTVTGTVTNSCGFSSTATEIVTVSQNAQFPTYFDLNNWPQTACPGSEIYLEAPGNMTSYIWDFGDGSPGDTSATNQVSHNYYNTGTFTASVTIVNYCGNDTTLTTTVTIDNTAPFTGWFQMQINPSPACPGSSVNFSVWSNEAVSYLWDFGDGDSSTFQSASNVYQAAGIYNASLTMTNSCGNDTTVYTTVNVNNSVMPNPDDYDYGVASDTACSGDSVLFYISPAGSGSYLWNFGDGTSTTSYVTWTDVGGSTDITTHIYSNNGTYNVAFTLTNQCGNSFTDSFQVNLGSNVPVDGQLWINGDNFCKGDTIKFNSVGGGTYVWSFGDGSTPLTTSGVITEVFHAYVSAGEYPVSVNITNNCGNSAFYHDTIIIDSCVIAGAIPSIHSEQMKIFPNPNKGIFTVIPGNSVPGETYQLRIYNIMGEEVYYHLHSESSNPLSIDLSRQPAGIYFLQINSGLNSFNGRIIKE